MTAATHLAALAFGLVLTFAPIEAKAAERESWLTFKLSAGPEMRSFREIAIDGGVVSVGFGGHRGVFHGLAVARGLFGRTRGGLFVQNWSAGSDLLFVVGRAHIGVAPSATLLLVRRATNGNYLGAVGGGLEGVIEVDLLREEITEPDAPVRRLGSLFLTSRGGAHGLAGVDAAMLGASLALGWRIH